MLTAQLVEDHHMILPYWFLAREQYQGSVLVHIDEHMDYMRRSPAEQQQLIQAKDRLDSCTGDIHLLEYGLYCVEDFLSSVTLFSIFKQIVWVKPRQVNPLSEFLVTHVKNLDFIKADEVREAMHQDYGVILNDMELTVADSASKHFLPEPGSRVVLDVDLDFADKATPDDIQFAQAVMARLKKDYQIQGVTLCRSVNGGYIESPKAAEFLELVKCILQLEGIDCLATNYLLPEGLNRGLRLFREHKFEDAAKLFSSPIEGVDEAIVAHYLGHVQQFLGNADQARDAWQIALSSKPQQWLTRVQLGFLLAASQVKSDMEAGYRLLIGAQQERPETFRLNLSLTLFALFKLRDLDLARVFFETSSRIRPLAPEVGLLAQYFKK